MNEVLIINNAESAAANGAHDSHRDGLSDAKRIAHGQHNVADLQIGAVGNSHRRQVFGVHFKHGNIGGGIGAHDFSNEVSAAFAEADLHHVSAFHDMAIAEDVSIRSDNHAGAEALLLILPAAATTPAPPGRRRRIFVLLAIATKESAKERVIEQRGVANAFFHVFRGINGHYAGSNCFDDGRKAGASLNIAGQWLLIKSNGRRCALAPA